MSDTLQSVAYPQTSERRFHPRERVLCSCMQLEDDNGGIVLNLSESGLAMQVVRSLADEPLPQMRFQLSQFEAWVEARGRIAWISPSKRTVGVEFVGLPYEGRILIKRWISSIGDSSATIEENAPVEELALERPASTALEPASAVSVPEPETMERVVENPKQDSVAKDPAVVPPRATETRDLETVSQYSRATSAKPAAIDNTGRENRPPLYLSYEETTRVRGKVDRDQTSSPRKSRQWIGVLVSVLWLSTFFFLGIYFRNVENNRQSREVPATASQPALPSNDSVIPKNPPIFVDPKQPLDRPGFVLQVGAMTRKDDADALAESLRKRNFPAFVSRRGTDRFYRVIIGPYRDADSTFKVKEELRKQDFDAIRIQWNP